MVSPWLSRRTTALDTMPPAIGWMWNCIRPESSGAFAGLK
jgi:hypothetical protein